MNNCIDCKKEISKKCKNMDKNFCVLWITCDDCYYFESNMVCPNCDRKIPNIQFKRKKGCKWCQR